MFRLIVSEGLNSLWWSKHGVLTGSVCARGRAAYVYGQALPSKGSTASKDAIREDSVFKKMKLWGIFQIQPQRLKTWVTQVFNSRFWRENYNAFQFSFVRKTDSAPGHLLSLSIYPSNCLESIAQKWKQLKGHGCL